MWRTLKFKQTHCIICIPLYVCLLTPINPKTLKRPDKNCVDLLPNMSLIHMLSILDGNFYWILGMIIRCTGLFPEHFYIPLKNLASTSYFPVQFLAVDYTAELTVQLSHSWRFLMLRWTGSLTWQVHTIHIFTCMFPTPPINDPISLLWWAPIKKMGKRQSKGKRKGREREVKSLLVTQVSRV